MELVDVGNEAAQEPHVLALISRLVQGLDAAGVSYCHWKSNEAIARSASGENDLDILVARRHAATFADVAHRLGFRTARPPADRQLPGIVDYYATDHATARLVHLQAHYQLVLGDDTTKNFRLPIEEAYLESVDRSGFIPVPRPEFEYVLLVLRMVVKHATWDAQHDGKGRLTASEERELAYLAKRIDPREVDRLRERHLPFIGSRLFAACVRAAAGQMRPAARALTAQRLLRALRDNGRRPMSIDLALRLWRRRTAKVKRRIPGWQLKKGVDTGGLLVAVIGADGSGKSSAVDFLMGLLANDLNMSRFHLGKPPWSRLTSTIKRPMKKLRTWGLFRTTALPAWTDFHSAFPGLGFMVWHTLTARDRYLEYARARRAVARGGIAVCDRFPIPALRSMDGPRTGAVPGLHRRPFARWLAEREARYYANILAPDLLVVLRVPPNVAVARRGEDDAEFVWRRAAEVFDTDWRKVNAVVLDGSLPSEQVHAQLTDAVWAAL